MANSQVALWDGSGYRLAFDPVRIDVAEFGDLTSRARHASAAGNAEATYGLYKQALGLWRDDPLADLSVLADHPAVSGLNRERVAAVIEYADAAEAAGSPGQALDQLRMLAQRQPLDERVHARLMSALAATGQQAEALGVFEEMRLRLDRELGIRPATATARAKSSLVVVNSQNGRIRQLATKLQQFDCAVWDPRPPGIVVSHWAGEAEYLSGGGQILLPPSWAPLTRSPSGKELLVISQPTGSRSERLGLWRPSNSSDVTLIGDLTAGMVITEAVWLRGKLH